MTRCDWLLQLDAKDDLFACWRPVEAVLDVLSLYLAVIGCCYWMHMTICLLPCCYWMPMTIRCLLEASGGRPGCPIPMTRCDWLLQLDAKDDLFACWRPVEAVLDVLSL